MRKYPSIPWWLWPNVLNLDAPVVAVLWLELFAGIVEMDLNWGARTLLFLSVWEVYLMDHLFDGRKFPSIGTSARHLFHAKSFRRLIAPALVVSLIILGLAIKNLTLYGWIFAGTLSFFTLTHFVRTHFSRAFKRVFPKEICVGVIFAAGTVLLAATQDVLFDPDLFLPGATFAVLCALNCCFVTVWEKLPGDIANPDSLMNAFPKIVEKLIPSTLTLCIISLLLMILNSSFDLKIFYGASATSAAGFFCLDRFSNRWSGDLLRVLADVAMLTPAIALLIGRVIQ